MTLKTYQKIRMGVTVVLSIIFAQCLIFKNYFIPIALMVIGSLFLMFLKRNVKGVLADERDYQIAGKSAYIAMQVYAWIAAASMFVFYAMSEYNPAYEAIAYTLAFSTCFLMIGYSLVFKFYNKIVFTEHKFRYFILALILGAVMAISAIRVFSGEDNWMCREGKWIKHGNPSFPAPKVQCK